MFPAESPKGLCRYSQQSTSTSCSCIDFSRQWLLLTSVLELISRHNKGRDLICFSRDACTDALQYVRGRLIASTFAVGALNMCRSTASTTPLSQPCDQRPDTFFSGI